MTIQFFSGFQELKSCDENSFRAKIPPRINGEEELFQALASVLNFPNYFGNNWDALWDCLMDMDWIAQRCICVIHSDLPVLSKPDLKIYLNILNQASKDWKTGDAHILFVFFPSLYEEEIQPLLQDVF